MAASSHTAFEFAIGEEGMENIDGNCSPNYNKKYIPQMKIPQLEHNNQQPGSLKSNKIKTSEDIKSINIINYHNIKTEEEKLLFTELSYRGTPGIDSSHDVSSPAPSILTFNSFVSHSRHNSNNASHPTHSRNNSNISYSTSVRSRSRNNSNHSLPPIPFKNISSPNQLLQQQSFNFYPSLSIPEHPPEHATFYPTPLASFDSYSSPNDLYKLKQWLASFGLIDIYSKLIKDGYDSIDLFAGCDDDDVKEIVKLIKLSHAQKLKLKKAIEGLSVGINGGIQIPNSTGLHPDGSFNGSSVSPRAHRRANSILITEKEKLLMMGMNDYLDHLLESNKTIKSKLNLLDIEYKNKEKEICNEFSQMFNKLHHRKLSLIKELDIIYKEKKNYFNNTLNNISTIIQDTQDTQLILTESISNYNDDINKINDIETSIINIKNKCLKNIGPINMNTKIDVNINNNDIMQIISVLGDVHFHVDENEVKIDENDQTFHILEEESDDDDDIDDLEMKQIESELDNDDNDSEFSNLSSKSKDLLNDRWCECGDNLLITNNCLNYSKITNIGYKDKGSGYGSHIIFSGVHYWKLKILGNSSSSIPFAVGFVSSKYGTSKRNNFFLSHNQSIGLYNNGLLICGGKKKKSIANKGKKGIIMKHKDIINLCFNFNKKYISIQRCEYNVNNINNKKKKSNNNNMDYIVHSIQHISLKKYGLNINNTISNGNGYRLGCFLKEKNRSICIVEYTQNPFEEWKNI